MLAFRVLGNTCTLEEHFFNWGFSEPTQLYFFPARAVTGRRNSYSGRGEDFFSRQPNFFTETAETPERKVGKSFPRWEINRRVEGSSWVINENLGRMAKIGFFWPKTEILGPKKGTHFWGFTMFWPRPEKVVQRKKCLCPNNQGGKDHFG